jgi:replicative superfamily II helicase
MFLKKKGYVNTFYNKIVPIIKKNYKKVLNNIDFSGIKEFKKKIIKKIKPYSKLNINKIINEYYPNKKQNKIIKDKLKELTKKLNV